VSPLPGCRSKVERIRRRGSDYLLYALLDVIIDHAFPLLEAYGERIETLEDALLDRPELEILSQIHQLRRELLLMIIVADAMLYLFKRNKWL
jgi:magnesium transporter